MSYKLFQKKYSKIIFFLLGIIITSFYLVSNPTDLAAEITIWYKSNQPIGTAKGIFPGRVAWTHNSQALKWDGKTGFWWEDKFNNQDAVDGLLKNSLMNLAGTKNVSNAWDKLFKHYNLSKRNTKVGYQKNEKIVIKINQNNTKGHESNNEINASPHLVLSILKSLINDFGVEQNKITVTDPSRFITDNIFNKCNPVFPDVHYVDHIGGNGREKADFYENVIPYSIDNGKVATGLAKCVVDADYVINMALLKGHVSQGVTLAAKNYFGCTSIETDWRKNAHSSGFSQNKDGTHKYLVFTDYLGHKDLGEKTMLFLIDALYSNKFVNGIPSYKWKLSPFNNQWPSSLFLSQDGVAIDAVALDFVLNEWPDAPDLMYSDYYLHESATADNPPSGTVYDPERDGTTLKSLGVFEHWNNSTEKKYSRNLGKSEGIELLYINTKN